MKLTCAEFCSKFAQTLPTQAQLLDVRNDDEVAKGTLKGAKHIPVQELSTRLQELDSNKSIFIYCKAGGRAQKAESFLKEMGFQNLFHASGGGFEELNNLLSK